MGIFDKRGGGLLGGGWFDDGPSLTEKVEMLFTDAETEGKKRGYDRAAKEYGAAYKKIEEEYKETKIFIEEQKNTYGNQAYRFVERLEALERQKADLEKKVNIKVNAVSRKYNIPAGDIRGSMAAGALIVGGYETIDILGLIYSYKEKKLRKAEQAGYVEAKEVYEAKIKKLKEELKRLKEKGDGEIKTLLNQISQILDAITDEEMKIAELKILL